MGGFSWIHWAVVIILVVVLFGGRGKISDVMGDFARGIKSFKKGLSDQDDTSTPQVRDDTKDKTH